MTDVTSRTRKILGWAAVVVLAALLLWFIQENMRPKGHNKPGATAALSGVSVSEPAVSVFGHSQPVLSLMP